MSRAEKRREKREQFKRSNATFNLTKEQLDISIGNAIKDRLEEIKSESVDTAMILALTLPLQVLMDYYWTDLDERVRFEELSMFADRLVDYYEKWQNGELDIQKLKDDLWTYGGIKIVGADYICKEGEMESRY